ncbi:MAG: GNAT family N-acetyltransferase [Marinilabiliaceae bacterium]|nr:GNAT family N-acetyltransferase [Marinilabiliaceae bacterium]
MSNYIIRNAHDQNDINQLKPLFNTVFHPEKVGDFAETMSHHLPGLKPDHWFVAEDAPTHSIVSAFALIPWQWEMAGIPLKVAEMGIVGTQANHRGKGLMKRLNHRFDHRLREENYDLAVIQGIPGFYHKFGYHYCVALENHMEIPLHLIDESSETDFVIREATQEDIPFLKQQDELYRQKYFLSVSRSKEQWTYLLSHSKETEYGADYWIIEHPNSEQYYARIPYTGFGYGLIISEVSEQISWPAMEALMTYAKGEAIKKKKPYLRLNLHHDSIAAQWAIQKGVQRGLSYAWQIKVVNKLALLQKMKPILEKRVLNSSFKGWNETVRLDLYGEQIDLKWKKGQLKEVNPESDKEVSHTFCIPSDLFALLILGHRSWQELQLNRPDIAPMLQYIKPEVNHLAEETGALIETLFPKCQSWIYEQY